MRFAVQEAAQTLTWIDWGVVAAYFGLVALIGVVFARRQTSTEEYFMGGRAVPGWAAGISLFAGAISTATFVAYPADSFGADWTNLLPGFMLPLAVLFITLVVIPFYRRTVRAGPFEYLEKRFGYPARVFAATLYILNGLFRMGLIIFLEAKAIQTMTGWDVRWVILATGIITIGYTVLGGIEAVICTDVLQTGVLLLGGLVSAGILLATTSGGPVRMIEMAAEADKFRLAQLSLDLSKPTILVMLCMGFVGFCSGYSTTQETVQRYLAVKSTHEARKGVWIGACGCLFSWTLFMFIGSLLYSFYQINPGLLSAEVAADPTQIFPYFVKTRLPTGVVGLVLAAMCAAGVSCLDTNMNSMALVSINDFYRRARPHASDQHLLRLSKIATCFWGLLGTTAGLAMLPVKEALDFSYVGYSILAGGLFGIFLLAFLVRRAHALGVYVGLAAGVLITAWGSCEKLLDLVHVALPEVCQRHPFPFHACLLSTCSNVTSFVVGLVASYLLPDFSKRRSAGLTVWDAHLHEPHSSDLPGIEGQRDPAI